MLSNSAFNALLKTIEEPPPYIIFIFATTEIHKVPATIRSRCQQFNFRLISVEVIKELLASACVDEGIEAEDDALFWIAKEATGSMRDGFTLFDQVAAFSDGEITLEKIREKLGLVGLDKLNTLIETIISGDGSAVMEQVDAILFQGVAVEQFVGDLGEYFRNLLFMRHGVRSESLLGYNPERFSPAAREAFTVEQLELTVEMILKLFRDLRFSLNQRYELELLLSRIAGLTSYLSPKQMLGEIKRMKALLAGEGSGEGGGSSDPRKPLIRIDRGSQPSASSRELPSREEPNRTPPKGQGEVSPAAAVPPQAEMESSPPEPAARNRDLIRISTPTRLRLLPWMLLRISSLLRFRPRTAAMLPPSSQAGGSSDSRRAACIRRNFRFRRILRVFYGGYGGIQGGDSGGS